MKLRRGRTQQDKDSRWAAIKSIRPPEPVIVLRVELQLVHDVDGNVIGSVNRAWRRRKQHRYRGVPVVASSPRAIRVSAVDPDGRASCIRDNRFARSAAQGEDYRESAATLAGQLVEADLKAAGVPGLRLVSARNVPMAGAR